MNCDLCRSEADALHRINPKGAPGRFVCTSCIRRPPPAVCEVPGCVNSSQKWAGHEYLCSRHWPLVPKRLRRRRAQLRRMYARRRVDSNRYQRVNYVIWRAMVKAAIEAAGGVG